MYLKKMYILPCENLLYKWQAKLVDYFTVFVKYICIFIALFIFITQQLKSLLLKSLVDVWLCLFFASFLSDLPHAFWRCIMCACLGLLSVYGSSSFLLFISTNIPCPKVKSAEVCLGRQLSWSAGSSCCLFFICFRGCKVWVYLRTVGPITSSDV